MTTSTPSDSQRPTRDRIIELIEAGDPKELARVAAETHPADIAELLDSLDEPAHLVAVFDVLGSLKASEVVREVGETAWQTLQEHVTDARLAGIVEQLDTDDAADILGRLPEERRTLLLGRTSPEIRREVSELLTYPEDTAGGIMKTEVATVTSDKTIREIIEYLRSKGEVFHDVHNVFVTDARELLLGYVPVRRLLLAAENTAAKDIMETDVPSVRVDVDQEEVAHMFEKYDLLSMPVVDAEDRLVGRITVDDIVDVMQEEATEDILRLAGVSGEEVTVGRPLQAVRNRMPWLALNLLTASAAAATIARFEGTIQAIAIAAALMTIVASQGGNAATQTMTLTVRGLALGQLDPRQVFRLLGRESLVELANGVLLGAVAGSVVYWWRGDLRLSLVLAAAMIANLQIAALVGSLVPPALKVMGVDPAVASSVFVTAATDIFGFFIFLGLLTFAF